MKRRWLALLLLLSGPLLWAQTTPAPSTPSSPTTVAPVPYQDEEFDPLLLKLRRAEIIAIGAFPLVYLLSGLGYDYFYYFDNGLPQENRPWPLGPGTSLWIAPSQSDLLEKKNVTLVTVSLLTGIALAAIDWGLGL